VKLRAARADEEAWVNARYAEVSFQPSSLPRDLVIVAEIDDRAAGMGRLVPLDDRSCELGGMVVFEEFRGRGVARAIIDELLSHAEGRAVYCIPFAELSALYEGAGFRQCHDAPRAMLEKFEWCRQTYDKPVMLMRHQRK
jgi:GNAT superfamily N-acetyltransferase